MIEFSNYLETESKILLITKINIRKFNHLSKNKQVPTQKEKM